MRRAFALLTAFALVGCTDTTGKPIKTAPALKLVAYDSCEELLDSVRKAAKQSVGPYGFNGGRVFLSGGPAAEAATSDRAAMAPAQAQAPAYSGTNTHERGVDEPDLVKTDGKRIVVVSGGSLHVIDAASRRETHRMPVTPGAHQMLMYGNKVLVLSSGGGPIALESRAAISPIYQMSTQAELIDLDSMKLIGDFKIDARLIDARQVGGSARIVVANSPSIKFPQHKDYDNPEQQILANQQAIERAPIEQWLPRIVVNGQSSQIDCSDISRPDEFSGASMVTVLSFDLGASTLSQGDPVSVLADGDTVYGNGPSLYLANDQRWRGWRGDVWNGGRFTAKTELYQFDVTGAKPEYVASGNVPGWLLNQYSMSEFDDILRVATTDQKANASSVYTLRREGGTLRQIGEVGGLGKGERIYAVRFVGKIGYVVTFRQTDPLYTVDLSNPRAPRVVGELKIPGYSAYLHPVNETRLIGVGQDATERGRVQGTQLSLFDVGDLSAPKRIAQHKIARGHSEAEHDPHAFLYWPAARLLVIPVNTSALLVEVGDESLRELGTISHGRGDQIRRSLVIGDTLWTISHNAAMASTLDGGRELAFVNL